jgi:hypothetical protein
MTATFQTDGALNTWQGGNALGAASTGIGVASNQSGPLSTQIEFTVTSSDFVAPHIGDGALSVSASNTGNIVQEPVAITAGSGYTNGSFYVESNASGGQPAAAAKLLLTVAGGAITAASVGRAGSGFTSAPTFTVANALSTDGQGTSIGGGTGGALVVTVALDSRATMLGAAFGTNKGTQRLQAVGAVAINAAVTPSSYLNRSGRALVAGDQLWAVAP